jgi:hypothetical protein
MAGGVALMLHVLPPVPDLLALAITVPLGMMLYGAALYRIAPERIAEALHFARNRGEPDPAPAPAE